MIPRRRSTAAALLAGVVIMVVLAAACSGPRSGASATSEVSGCAAVLPLAHRIVHGQGTLTLIRRIDRADADALAGKLGVTPTPPPTRHPGPRRPHPPPQTRQPKTCLIVYHGNYPPGTIAGASPPAVGGHYALMVLRVRHPSVERVLVADQLPADLSHHSILSKALSMTW